MSSKVTVTPGQGGAQWMVRGVAGNGGMVQVKVTLTQLEQKQMKPDEQVKVVRERAKAALLEIAGKL